MVALHAGSTMVAVERISMLDAQKPQAQSLINPDHRILL